MLRQVLVFLIQHLVFLMLLATGLRMSFDDIRSAFERRGLLVRTLLVTSLVVPLLAMLVVSLVPVSPLARGIILLFAICPGAPFILIKFKGPSHHLPSVLLALVSALAVVTLPIWVAIIDRVFALDFQISPATVLQLSLRTVLLPLLLGIAIHQFAPRAAAPLAKVADILYKVSLLVVLVVVLVKVAPMLLRVQPIGIFAVLLATVLATLAGHWAGRPALEDRKVVASFAALGNPGLAAAVLAHSYPDLKAGMLVLLYVLVRALVIFPYNLWVNRSLHKPEHHEPTQSPPRQPPRPAPAAA